MAEYKGVVFSRERLLEVVWGYDFAARNAHGRCPYRPFCAIKLRGMDPTIDTIWGVGYKLDDRENA